METGVFWSILHRKILFELVRVFALSLLGITGIMVMAGIVAEASQQGLSPAQIISVIPLLIPSSLPYTIPATTLFATCVVYGRLAHDNEILAIKAAGVNVMKAVWPAVVLGAGMSAVSMGLYHRLIPYTHFLLRSQFLNEVEEYLYSLLRKDHSIKQPGLNYAIFVRSVHGKQLEDAIFKRRDPKTHEYDVMARARTAELRYEPVNRKLLVRMHSCRLYSPNGQGAGYFQDHDWEVDLPTDQGVLKNPKPRAMSWPDLFERRAAMKAEMDARTAEIAMSVARRSVSGAPDDLPQHIENLKWAQKALLGEIRSLETEIQMRPALCCGCLCFVLVGCPVGIWFSRSDYLSAFISCFLPIIFIYYPLLLCGTNLAKQGRVPAAVAMWAADAFIALIAMICFRQLLKH
jgi:lipopolysaccharide export system permease protein